MQSQYYYRSPTNLYKGRFRTCPLDDTYNIEDRNRKGCPYLDIFKELLINSLKIF
jgi:hypothetical protein